MPHGPERTPLQIMRPLPITFEAISKYADRYGVAEIEEFEDFSYTVRVLDQAYIQHQMARFHA